MRFICSASYVPNFKAVAYTFGFLFTFVFPKYPTSYIRLLSRSLLGEKLRNLGLSFLYVKWRYSHIIHFFQRSVRKLKECDISLKWKVKAKIIWKESQGFPETFASLILVNIGETRGTLCLSWLLWNLKPYKFAPHFWLCKLLHKLFSLFVSIYLRWGLIAAIL